MRRLVVTSKKIIMNSFHHTWNGNSLQIFYTMNNIGSIIPVIGKIIVKLMVVLIANNNNKRPNWLCDAHLNNVLVSSYHLFFSIYLFTGHDWAGWMLALCLSSRHYNYNNNKRPNWPCDAHLNNVLVSSYLFFSFQFISLQGTTGRGWMLDLCLSSRHYNYNNNKFKPSKRLRDAT